MQNEKNPDLKHAFWEESIRAKKLMLKAGMKYAEKVRESKNNANSAKYFEPGFLYVCAREALQMGEKFDKDGQPDFDWNSQYWNRAALDLSVLFLEKCQPDQDEAQRRGAIVNAIKAADRLGEYEKIIELAPMFYVTCDYVKDNGLALDHILDAAFKTGELEMFFVTVQKLIATKMLNEVNFLTKLFQLRTILMRDYTWSEKGSLGSRLRWVARDDR